MSDYEYNGSMGNPSINHARTRAFFTLGAVCVGVIVSRSFEVHSVGWLGVACGLLALVAILPCQFRSPTMTLCVVMLAGGWAQMRTNESPSHRLDQIVVYSGAITPQSRGRIPIEISGMIVDRIGTQTTTKEPGDPPTWANTRTFTQLSVDQVLMSDVSEQGSGGWVKASGLMKLLLPDSFAHSGVLKPGDRVRALGLFAPGGVQRNLGDLDWEALGKQSGRVGTLVIADGSMIDRVEYTGAGDRIHGAFIRWRSMLATRAIDALAIERIDGQADGQVDGQVDGSDTSEARSILAALLLGQRDPAFNEVYGSFQRVGVAHVLAISGFHLALVIMIGLVGVRLIGEFPRAETTVVIGLLIAGMIVVPMRPPIVRAGLIVMVFLAAGARGRRYDRLTILGWVGVALLIWRPMDVYSLGYQLSMGVTGFLIVLSDRVQETTLNRLTFRLGGSNQTHSPSGIGGRAIRWMGNAIRVNVACWVVAMPVIMFHAGIMSVLAPLVSLVLLPMIMVLMVLGYLQIIIGMMLPELGEHTIWVVDAMALSVGRLVGTVDTMPGSSFRIGSTGVLWTIAVTGFIGAIASGYWRIHRRAVWRTCVAIGVLIVWGIGHNIRTQDRSILRIDMLDVGDGSCLLIQSQGQGVLWDCGSLDRRVGQTAARAAREIGLAQVCDVVVTHDNIDHFNGLIDLTPLLGVERVWISRRMIEDPSPAWRQTQHELKMMGVEIYEISDGTMIPIGELELRCLWPDPDGDQWGEGLSENNTSVVMCVEVPISSRLGGDSETISVLLTGDIEREAMEGLMQSYPSLLADIIELPHHGSSKPGAYGFVESLNPSVVLQSTGPSRLNDQRWDGLRRTRSWYASADRGGAWVRIMRDGRIKHGWAVE